MEGLQGAITLALALCMDISSLGGKDLDHVGDQTDLVLHQISLWVYLLSHSFSLTAVVQGHGGFGQVHGSFGCTITERTLPRNSSF